MNRFFLKYLMFLSPFACLAMGVWISVCPLAAAAEISDSHDVKLVVAETNLVLGPKIFLGEVAQIQASPFLKEVLQKIELGNSPKPGKIKQLNKKRLVSLIRSQPGVPEGVLIDTPKKIYVKRASQQIEQQVFQAQVDLFLSGVFKGKKYDLTQLKVDATGVYPQGDVELAVGSKSSVDKRGNLTIFMDILIDGNREDRIRISGKVAVYETILCAVRDLSKGERLLETDVYSVRKNIFDLRTDVVGTYQEIDKKILKTNLKKDDYIKSSCLQEIPLIHKGELISLVARRKTLLIVTSAISKEDGYADQMIRVENIGSGKIVRGLVKERSTVEVIY
ncbi:MAG: flagella basal body P-ring formation protein FlgA [Deltaproteobacteria bacterium]|nr:MAG: flagella basal body P-ring formation protein FlgA [Deltaproteobacteria bacterium]